MATDRVIYTDNNATTRVAPEIVKEMSIYFSNLYGNPSSMHTFGGQVAKNLTLAREHLADILGAEADEIIFTSCGTESDNTAINAAIESYPNKHHIITTKVEHPAIISMLDYLEKNGYRITYLAVDNQGMINLDELRNVIDDDTVLVTIMYANNEIGNIYPIEEIGKIVKSSGALFHSDAVQVLGKIPLNMKNSRLDMLSLSGHKFHAPKGIGALYIRKGTRFSPYLKGGHQEHGRRGGTENVPFIIALGKAAQLAKEHLKDENTRIKALRDKLENFILNNIPKTYLNGHPTNRLPNTTNISFEFIEGEAILLLLSELGICASSGSACTSGSLAPSHVLRAMQVPFTRIHGSIRFSLSRYNTEDDINYIIEHLPSVIQRLRNMSPYWNEEE